MVVPILSRSPRARQLLRHYLRHAPAPLVPPRVLARTHRFYLGSQQFVARTRFGGLIAGDTTDMIQRLIFLYGVWEPGLTYWLSRTLRPGDVFVDVGANIGYFSLLASSLVGDTGRVVAVEASPSIFEQLRANVSLNDATNVRTLHRAASNTTSISRAFRAPDRNLGASSLFPAEGFTDEGEVQAAPLHELLRKDEVLRARVIKIDVEGAEVEVIAGLLPALSMARPDLEIVVEVGGGPPGTRGASEAASEITSMLASRGFNAYSLARDSNLAAYARRTRPQPPRRVWGAADIDGEADLVYSRRDEAVLWPGSETQGLLARGPSV